MPGLILTVRDSIPDRMAGPDLGADDYLKNPFALEEFLGAGYVLQVERVKRLGRALSVRARLTR